MLPNLRQATIKPIITQAVAPGTLIHTDDYDIYARLPAWGYGHKTVCHAHGEYARDEDGDGFCEVHVNTIEGFWSLLKSGIRGTYHSVSTKHLQSYLDEYAFRYNNRETTKPLGMVGAFLDRIVRKAS